MSDKVPSDVEKGPDTDHDSGCEDEIQDCYQKGHPSGDTLNVDDPLGISHDSSFREREGPV